MKQTNDGKFVWKQQDTGEKPGRNPFFAGFKQISDEAGMRKRRPSKEMNKKKEFNGMVCPDNWRNEFMKNNSIRSGFSLEAQMSYLKAINEPVSSLDFLRTMNSRLS